MGLSRSGLTGGLRKKGVAFGIYCSFEMYRFFFNNPKTEDIGRSRFCGIIASLGCVHNPALHAFFAAFLQEYRRVPMPKKMVAHK